MKPDWVDEIEYIHTHAIKKSNIAPWSTEDFRFLTLALAGEVGELANFVKKEWRNPQEDHGEAIKKELTDIRVYLHLIARYMKIDLDDAVDEKLPEIRAKFPVTS